MNAGQELLRAALEREGFGLRQVAGFVGISKTMMGAILSGDRSPGAATRETFERLFLIPSNSWDHAPGWRLDGWDMADAGTAFSSFLTMHGMLAGLLEPTPISEARLMRDLANVENSKQQKETPAERVDFFWQVVSPELTRLPIELRRRLGVVDGRAHVDVLRDVVVGLMHEYARDSKRLCSSLENAKAGHCISFTNDLVRDAFMPKAAQ